MDFNQRTYQIQYGGKSMNTQVDLMNEKVTEARKQEIKKELKTKAFVKQAKKARHTDPLGQRRLNGQRINQKVIEFHESKDIRKKNARKRRQKVESERRGRVEQSTLF